jgi:fatty acid desaturase
MHFLWRIFIALGIHLWPFYFFSFGKAFAFGLFPMVIFSICFICVSQLGHVTPETTPVEVDPITKDGSGSRLDFYEHQISQTHNFGVDSLLCYYLSGGLNLQVEHHLFPGVNHCHLRELAPHVKMLCRKHNIAYHEASSGFLEALCKYLSVLAEMSTVEVPLKSNRN